MTRPDADDLLQRALDDALTPREKQAVAARVTSDAGFAAEAAALYELNGYLAGVRSAEPPHGFVREVMDEIDEAGVPPRRGAVKKAAAGWRHSFALTLWPRYAVVLIVGAALGSGVFWAAVRLGPDLDAPRLASATIGSRVTPAAARLIAAREISQAGAHGRLELRTTDTQWHVTATISPTRPIPVSLRCGDHAPLGFTHAGQAVGLTVDGRSVAWQQHAPGEVMVRFSRANRTPWSCTVSIDGTPLTLQDPGH